MKQTVDAPAIVLDPILDAAPGEADRDHMACCRDFFSDGPVISACGYTNDTTDDWLLLSDHLCKECVAIVQAQLRKFGIVWRMGEEALPGCVRDGSPCPSGEEAVALSRRILGMD